MWVAFFVQVLNAGVGRHGQLDEVSVADFDESFAVNVRGPFLFMRNILPVMCVQERFLQYATVGDRASCRVRRFFITC